MVEAALPVIEAAGGGAFMLFTSLRAMRERLRAAASARSRRAGCDYPLLVQGEGSRSEMLVRFRDLGNAVLVGSQSFWEGVDVRGEALSLVVIDKLPFAPPDDPVLAARIDRMNREGRSAFVEYQLPEAVITLKQGAGRLIRDETDRGVLMICDPRLLSRSYGKRMLASLPPMKLTRNAAEAVAFFTRRATSGPAPRQPQHRQPQSDDERGGEVAARPGSSRASARPAAAFGHHVRGTSFSTSQMPTGSRISRPGSPAPG